MTISLDISGALTVDEIIASVTAVDVGGSLDSVKDTVAEGTKEITGGMTDLCNLSGTLKGMLGNSSNDVMSSIKGSVTEIGSQLQSTVSDVMGQMQSAIGEMNSAISGLVKSASETFDAAKAAITEFLSTIKGSGPGVLAQIKSLINDVVSELNSVISSITGAVTDALDATTGAIKGIAKDMMASIKALSICNCAGAKDAVANSANIPALSEFKEIASSTSMSDSIGTAFGGMGDKLSATMGVLSNGMPSLPTETAMVSTLKLKLNSLSSFVP